MPRIVAELAATAAAPAVNLRNSLLDTPREVLSASGVVDSANKKHLSRYLAKNSYSPELNYNSFVLMDSRGSLAASFYIIHLPE